MDKIIIPFLSDNFRREHFYKSFTSIPLVLARRNGLRLEVGYVSDKKVEDKYLLLTRMASGGCQLIRLMRAIVFTLARAKTSKILLLTHIANYNTVLALCYKVANPKGKVYLKLDMDLKFFDYEASWISKLSIGLLLRLSAAISYESVKVGEVIKQHGIQGNLVNLKKLYHLPNCPSPRDFEFTEPEIPKKEKIMITVGRLSSFQKNVMLIIQALKGMDLREWKFVFIGSADKKTQLDILQLKKEGVNVDYFGEIEDRATLYGIYSKASYLVLSSRYEGFATVLIEASHRGCGVITTDVNGVDEVTNFGEFGEVFSNAYQLSSIIENIVVNNIAPKSALINEYVKERLTWDSVIENSNIEKVLL